MASAFYAVSIVLNVAGAVLGTLFLGVTLRAPKLVSGNVRVVGFIATETIIAMGMFIANSAQGCGWLAFFLVFESMMYAVYCILIPSEFHVFLLKTQLTTIQVAILAPILWTSFSLVWSASWTSVLIDFIALIDQECVCNFSPRGENTDWVLLLTMTMFILSWPGQLLLYLFGYRYSRSVMDAAAVDDFVQTMPEHIPGVITEQKSKTVIQFETPTSQHSNQTKTKQQKDNDLRLQKAARKIIAYTCVSILRSVLFVIAVFVHSPYAMDVFLLAIYVTPSLMVFMHWGSVFHVVDGWRCRNPRRTSDSGASDSSSDSQGKIKDHVVVHTEAWLDTSSTQGKVTILDKGLKLRIDPATKVPLLENLDIYNLLHYEPGVTLALAFSKRKNLQCEDNIRFYCQVQQYKALVADKTNPRAAWEKGKDIVREYMALPYQKANVQDTICVELRAVFAPAFAFVTGKEFDVSVAEVCGMMNDTFGFMGQFRKSNEAVKLARKLAKLEKDRRADDKLIVTRDLRFL